MMARWLWIGIGLLVVVGLWAMAVWPDGRERASWQEPAAAGGAPEPAIPSPSVAGRMAPSAIVRNEPAEAPARAQGSPEPEQQPAAAEPIGDILAQPFGPVAELKGSFESEPRDSAAAEVEPLLRAAFDDPQLNPSLLKSVLCRETVCKLELRWSPDRTSSYIKAMTLASVNFAPNPGVDPHEPAGDGIRVVDAYLKRKPAPP